jgi:predicted esterase
MLRLGLSLLLVTAIGGCSGDSGNTGGSGGTGAASGGAPPSTGGTPSSTGGVAAPTGGVPSLTATGGSPANPPSGGNGGSGGSAVAPAGGSAGNAPTATGGAATGGTAAGGTAGTSTEAGGGAGGRGGAAAAGGSPGSTAISFGTSLDPEAVVQAARELATSLADPASAGWRKKGDQKRTYRNAATGKDEPYRLCVPSDWDGTAALPVVMFLHGAGSDENSYLDSNDKQLVKLAEQHGYLLISPRGANGAYGNFLRLTAPFGDEAAAAALVAQATPETRRDNELSEQDVINVLELVLAEYPVDREALFLAGHSMGSGGTWYIGGKYSMYWKGLAPLSGPFVQKTGYPWEAVRRLSIFVTEGTQTPSLEASRLLAEWLEDNGFLATYQEVNADHGGMIPLVLPDIFDFFDRSR